MIVRPSRIGEMPLVAALVRTSFAPRLHPYMIYTQTGIAHFLSAMIAHPALFPDRILLTCAEDDGAPIGFAEFRVSDRTGLLSYICVSPEVRRRGIASAMIAAFLADHPALGGLELDVFTDNEPAIALYRKAGFRDVAGTSWFVRALPPSRPNPVVAANPAAALASFERYGFCELPMSWHGKEHRLGRIGTGVIRCFSASDYADDDLLAAMRYLMPELSEALLIQGADESAPLSGHEMNRSLRLSLDLPSPITGGASS